MSSGASIEASLRLEIAQYQQSLAKAKADASKWADKLKGEGSRGTKAVDDITAATKRANEFIKRTASLNPWAPMTTGAIRYASVVQKAAEAQRSVQSNPWITAGSSAYAAQQEAQQRLAARAAAIQRMDAAALAGGTGIISGNAALRAQSERLRMLRQMQTLGGKGGGGLQMAGLGMQMQDVVVQLQMGTRASTVLSQQGSQILSYFGTSGAIAGGVLALGGAFYTMAEKSREAFDAMKADADGFSTRMKASLSGTSTEIAAFYAEVKSGVNSAYSEIEKLNSGPSGIMARLTQFIGGPSASERETAANNLALQKANALATIQQALLDMSAKELRIAEMKAAGEDKAAASMQRQLDLQREIQRIQGTDLPDEVKARLAQDATRKSSLAGVEAPDKKAGERQLAELRALRKEAAQIAQDMLPDDEQLTALKAKLEDVLMAARVRNIGQRIASAEDLATIAIDQRAAGNTTAEATTLRDYKEALELHRQMASLRDRMAAAAKRAADEELGKIQRQKQHIQEVNQLLKERDEAQARKADAMVALQDEQAMLKARGTRRTSDDQKVEREIGIRRRKQQLMNDLGMSETDATAKATEMQNMQERASGRGRIRHTGRKIGMGSAGGGGLDAFYAQQGQDWGVNAMPESRFDKLQREGFDWSAGLKGKQEANAAAATAPSQVSLGSKAMEVFMQIKEAIVNLTN